MNQNTTKIDQKKMKTYKNMITIQKTYKNMITIQKTRIVKGKKNIKLKFKNLKA